jgi:hypothetical protein
VTGLVVLLWCVYLIDCFERQRQGQWTMRQGLLKPMRGFGGPDFQIFDGSEGFIWTPLLPWHRAYAFSGDDFDVQRARLRFDDIRADTRWLAGAATALFAWVMVLVPMLILTERLAPVLMSWSVVAIALWLGTLVSFFTTYRAVHDARPRLEVWLTISLSPITLMRAAHAVRFRAAEHLHPVTAAAVLCGDDEFVTIARCWSFDRTELRSRIEAIAKGRGLLERLTAGPENWEAGVSQYCPRCHSTYRAAATRCQDCPALELLPLVERSHRTA